MPSRPVLVPGLRVFRRDDRTLQVGLDERRDDVAAEIVRGGRVRRIARHGVDQHVGRIARRQMQQHEVEHHDDEDLGPAGEAGFGEVARFLW